MEALPVLIPKTMRVIYMKYEMRARRRRNRMYKCNESNDD